MRRMSAGSEALPMLQRGKRPPPISSQKYKSFHYSRVDSVAEEQDSDGQELDEPLLDKGRQRLGSRGQQRLGVSIEERMTDEEAAAATAAAAVTPSNAGVNSSPVNLSVGQATMAGGVGIGGSFSPNISCDEGQKVAHTGTGSGSGSRRPSPSNSTTRRPSGISPPKTRRLLLSPAALHMSMDMGGGVGGVGDGVGVSGGVGGGSTGVIGGYCQDGWPQSKLFYSTDNVHRKYSCQTSAFGSRIRPSSGRNRCGIANISAEFMRASGGAGGQFRGILASPGGVGMKRRKDADSRKSSRQSDIVGSSTNRLNFSTTTLSSFFGFSNNYNRRESRVTDCGAVSIEDPRSNNQLFDPEADLKRPSPTIIAPSGEVTCDLSQIKGQRADGSVGQTVEPAVAAGSGVNSGRAHYRTLFNQRRQICDYSVALAVAGIAFMVVDHELVAAGYFTKASAYSYCFKSIIVITTLMLMALVVSYHTVEIKLFMVDYGCSDWRVCATTKRMMKIVAELMVCSICPIPGDYHFQWDILPRVKLWIPVDILLSIPMFLRLYLLVRLMLLHSRLFTDAPSRSISALNRVNVTARFVLKTLMTMSPVTILLSFTASFWLIAAWVMLACERYGTSPEVYQLGKEMEVRKHQSIIIEKGVAVTSLGIGYGELIPNTYCGRAVSIVCGIVGAGTSSLVVAVVARKLEFSRAEKHVHNFMADSILTKKMKNAAANVLRETWLIYKHQKLMDKIDANKIRHHQRKFLLAIYEMRQAKRDQRKLNDSSTIADMAKTTAVMYDMLAELRSWQQETEQKILNAEQHCANLDVFFRQLQVSICSIPELVARNINSSIIKSSP